MYEISDSLKDAIESIFDNSGEGYLAIGNSEFGGFKTKNNLSEATPPLERIGMLRRIIEDWVELYGMEIEEFDSEYDLTRISSEARAMLLVLREINRCFPESSTEEKPIENKN